MAARILLIRRTCPLLIVLGWVIWKVFVIPVSCLLRESFLRCWAEWVWASVLAIIDMFIVWVRGRVTCLGIPQLCPPSEVGIGRT